jgi:hypothetical protein
LRWMDRIVDRVVHRYRPLKDKLIIVITDGDTMAARTIQMAARRIGQTLSGSRPATLHGLTRSKFSARSTEARPPLCLLWPTTPAIPARAAARS